MISKCEMYPGEEPSSGRIYVRVGRWDVNIRLRADGSLCVSPAAGNKGITMEFTQNVVLFRENSDQVFKKEKHQ